MKYIIAEIGSSHDGSFGNACKLIELAKECGAGAVKFQMHIPSEETLTDAPNPNFFSEENRFEYFKRTSFSIEQWKKLIIVAKERKIKFICSAFSIKAVQVLYNLGVDTIKIPSGEVTNIKMIEAISNLFDNVLLST